MNGKSVRLITPLSNLESTYGIALHTSSPDLGLAIDNFAGDDRHQVWKLGRDLSTHLHSSLSDFLKPQSWADLAFIAVATGPGGFTGTRIGVVTARTLAQQLQIPLFGVSSLAAIAHSEHEGTIAVQMPAQRGELYAAIYQNSSVGLTALLPDAVLIYEAWQQILSTWDTPYQLIEAKAEQGEQVTTSLKLAHLQWQQDHRSDWSEVLPFYGQHPVHH